MVMTVIRSMDRAAERLLLEAYWPDGTTFRYSLGPDGVRVEDFPGLKPGRIIRGRTRHLVAVEGPSHSITLLTRKPTGGCRLFVRRLIRQCTRSYSPLPLDDNEIGTAWGSLDVHQLYRELERLGFHVHRTDWKTFLPDTAGN